MSFYSEIEQVNITAPLPPTLLRVVQQRSDCPRVVNIKEATIAALQPLLVEIQRGDTVAVGVGSRGIAHLVAIVKTTTDELKRHGALPFLFPAMGSHGGATAEGQVAVLHNLGITQDSIGVEIRATMNVVQIGQLPNHLNLYQDAIAATANHTILINRIKAHTSFSSNIESGLAKAAVIGMGKQKGAQAMHARGVVALKTCLAPAARMYEKHTNLIGGLAIVENAHEETAQITGLTAKEIGTTKEEELLKMSKTLMARLPFEKIDVLVVQQLGKNLSGTGMDTNVIGRFKIPRQPEPTDGPDICVICVLDLTGSNANGMGLANVITSRLAQKVDWKATYTNALTSGILGMWKASMPITMASDERAIQAAVLGCGEADARIVFVKNTLELDQLWASPNLRSVIDAHPHLKIVEEVALTFDDEGTMQSPWSMT